MPVRVLQADQEESITRAAEMVMAGGVVAVPTESFYGLAVNALNEKAIERLLAIKKRREDHPFLILIDSADVLKRYAAQIPPVALPLIEAFWPGGLTMVFEAKPVLPLLLTGGTGKVGVRLCDEKLQTVNAQRIIRERF